MPSWVGRCRNEVSSVWLGTNRSEIEKCGGVAAVDHPPRGAGGPPCAVRPRATDGTGSGPASPQPAMAVMCSGTPARPTRSTATASCSIPTPIGALPLADIGCGNGRFTRGLAGRFPRAVGVDVSPAAVARAHFETNSGQPTVSFNVLDVTEPGAGSVLRERPAGGRDRLPARSPAHPEPARPPTRRVEHRHSWSATAVSCSSPRRSTADPASATSNASAPAPAASRRHSTGLSRRECRLPLAFGEVELDECFPAAAVAAGCWSTPTP